MTADAGKTVKLGDYFGHKPLILNLVYYNCTMLCGEALAGLASAMRLVKFDVAPCEMASVLTTESLNEMDLKVGDKVSLVVKAVNVLPVKE